MSLNKTKRYSRHTYGDNGALGHRNILSVSFVAVDLGAPKVNDTDGLLVSTAVSNLAATTLIPTSQPDVPRNITLTVTATVAADIAGDDATITGTNVEGKTITDTVNLVADTQGTFVGSKAFKTVTSVSIPQQDGASVEVAIGYGALLGIGMRNIASMPVKVLVNDGGTETIEDGATIAYSATNVEDNTVDTTTANNGSRKFRVYVLNYKWAINPTNGTPDYGV